MYSNLFHCLFVAAADELEKPKRPRTVSRGNKGTWNESMLRSLLENFDTSQRPQELRQPVCSPSLPVSRVDLSDSALAFTEPKGSFPSIDRGGAISGFERGGHEAFQDFLDKARALSPRTPGAMMGLLPQGCKLSENDVRHLFRNYADIREVHGNRRGPRSAERISFSLRELEIMMYAKLKKMSDAQWNILLPYRPAKNLYGFRRELFQWCGNFKDCDAYKQHLEETVGVLFRLENGESVVPAVASASQGGTESVVPAVASAGQAGVVEPPRLHGSNVMDVEAALVQVPASLPETLDTQASVKRSATEPNPEVKEPQATTETAAARDMSDPSTETTEAEATSETAATQGMADPSVGGTNDEP